MPPFQRDSITGCIADNPTLRPRTVITTYYQETFNDREIDLEEFLQCAKRGGRPFFVFILECSEKENMKRMTSRSSGFKTKLTDLKILEEIRKNHFVFSFYDAGFKPPDVWEFRLDVEDLGPQEAASSILEQMSQVLGQRPDSA